MVSTQELALTTVEGGSALSPFRARALLARLQAVDPAGHRRQRALRALGRERAAPRRGAPPRPLERLLTYGDPYAGDAPSDGPAWPSSWSAHAWARSRRGRARPPTSSTTAASTSAASSGSPSTALAGVDGEPLTGEAWGAVADGAARPDDRDRPADPRGRCRRPLRRARGRADGARRRPRRRASGARKARTRHTGWLCPTTRSTTSPRRSPGCGATRPTSS